MGDGNNADDVFITAEDECVRESSQRQSPMDCVQLLAERGKLDEHSAETLDLEEEIVAQSLELTFIVFGCVCQFLLRRRKETRLSLLETRADTLEHFVRRNCLYEPGVEISASPLHLGEPGSISIWVYRTVQLFQQRSQKALLLMASQMPDFALNFRYSPCHNALPRWLNGSSVSPDLLDR